MSESERTSRRRIEAHFKKVDPVIYRAFKEADVEGRIEVIHTKEQYFLRLTRAIIGQQLSVKAAATIRGRVDDLYPGKLTAKKILAIPDAKLREAGMSWGKVSYLKDLAEKTVNGELRYEIFETACDEEILKELTSVKGIGVWSAEMFLMFALGHEDVFSYGDLGLRRGLEKLYKLKKEPTLAQAKKITDKWSPYRTYGSLALWNSLDNM